MPRINYTNEEKAGGNFLLKPGEYEVSLTDYKFGKSNGPKTRGSDTINLKLETSTGQWIFDTLIFHESSGWKVSAFLRCFGVTFEEGAEIDVDATLLDSLIGHTGTINVGNKAYAGNNPDYAGTQQNVLKSYIPANGTKQKRAEPAAVAHPGEDLDIQADDIPF